MLLLLSMLSLHHGMVIWFPRVLARVGLEVGCLGSVPRRGFGVSGRKACGVLKP